MTRGLALDQPVGGGPLFADDQQRAAAIGVDLGDSPCGRLSKVIRNPEQDRGGQRFGRPGQTDPGPTEAGRVSADRGPTKARPTLPSLLTAGTGTIGVRISSHQAATGICSRAGGAITATSANISGQRPARTVTDLIDSFEESIDLIVDGGELTYSSAYGTDNRRALGLLGLKLDILHEGCQYDFNIREAFPPLEDRQNICKI